MVTEIDIKEWIEQGLPGSQVVYSRGDGAHFEAVVLSDKFHGLNLIARHRLVYTALGNRMKVDIHALSLKTFTHQEYNQQSES